MKTQQEIEQAIHDLEEVEKYQHPQQKFNLEGIQIDVLKWVLDKENLWR